MSKATVAKPEKKARTKKAKPEAASKVWGAILSRQETNELATDELAITLPRIVWLQIGYLIAKGLSAEGEKFSLGQRDESMMNTLMEAFGVFDKALKSVESLGLNVERDFTITGRVSEEPIEEEYE